MEVLVIPLIDTIVLVDVVAINSDLTVPLKKIFVLRITANSHRTASTIPSLPLFSSDDDRKFSHVGPEIIHQEVQTDHSSHVYVSRDVFTQSDIDALYEGSKSQNEPKKSGKIPNLGSCRKSMVFNMVFYFLPIVTVLQKYCHDFRSKVIGDFMGGISVACMHFPQGLAYGLLASLTPVEGLYSTFFPVLFYTIFGTSQHMSFATDSVIAILTAEIIDTQVKNNFHSSLNASEDHDSLKAEMLNYRIGVSATCTFVCGSVLVVMGIFRLGFLTSYQSKSFIGGFTTAAAFHIFTSQIPKGLGIEIPLVKGIGKLVYTFQYIFEDIRNTNVPSLIIVILCVIFIVFIKDFINEKYKRKLRVPVPADLLTIIIATIISTYTHLETSFGIEVVGSIPVGIPDPKLPDLSLYLDVFPECFQMALLIFFLSIAMAKVCAEQNEYEICDNKELMAYGLTNVGCSFFPCFPASVSPPRNMILSSMGAKTTLNGVFTTFVMLLVLYVLGQLFAHLPVPALAAMIFVSVKPLLLQVRTLPKLYRVNVYDMVIWIATCSSGILLDLPYGLIVGIGVSFITVVIQSQRTDTEVKYRTNDHIFLRKEHQPHISASSKVVVFHMCSALYFATSERFRKKIYESTLNPLLMKYKPVREIEVTFSYSSSTETFSSNSQKSNRTSQASDLEGPLKVIIIDCSAVTYIDIQGVNTLSVVFEEYRRAGITVFLASCTPYMWNCLQRSDFFDVVSRERVFFELEDAFYAANEVINANG